MLVPIYPGHKDCPFDAAAFSLERLAEDMAVFIQQELNSGAVDLVGWSLGGCLSCLIAIHHPNLVRSLTLISTAPSFGEDVFGNTLDLHDELKAHRDILEIVFDGAEDILASLSAGAPMSVLRYYYEELMRFDVNARLSGIAMPVLLTHGQNDCVIDKASFDKLRRIPQAAELVVKGHGHFDPDPKSCAIQKQKSRMILTPKSGGDADEKITIRRRADCFCPEAGRAGDVRTWHSAEVRSIYMLYIESVWKGMQLKGSRQGL